MFIKLINIIDNYLKIIETDGYIIWLNLKLPS